MKKLFLLLSVAGMLMTACGPIDDGTENENGNGNPTEQPGNGNTGNQDEPEKPADKTQAIKFQDERTKLICTLHWDKNEDGELSYEEAAAVTNLGTAFKGSAIMTFSELEHFTSLTNIAKGEFKGCSSLIKISLPEQITAIGDEAFSGCTNLKKIEIPDSVNDIGINVFYNCKSLTSIIIPHNVDLISSGAFQNCKSLASVTICNGVRWIGGDVFNGCSSLTNITIPNSVESIGRFAFGGCSSLTSITIPDSINEIKYGAFCDCSKLICVYCKATTPPTGDDWMFDGNASGRKIYVPRNSEEAYKSAEYWKEYADDIVGYDF